MIRDRAEYKKLYYKNHKKELREKRIKKKDKLADYSRRYNYSLSSEDYLILLGKQNNRCAICENLFVKTPHVDHNHETGKVRGLLCHKCNVSLAVVENSDYIAKALKYLECL
jgi:hypothetical protein